jgi:hypothetical protein
MSDQLLYRVRETIGLAHMAVNREKPRFVNKMSFERPFAQ